MKKSFIFSLVCCSFVLGSDYINPLPVANKAIENGGTLYAIDAYQDGVGAVVIKNGRPIDNSSMNSLVFKYGSEAKSNSLNLADQVVLSGNSDDLSLAKDLFPDGSSCNDGNPDTAGETYLDGVCQGGTVPDGTICNDGNANTSNDKYTNGVCSGTALAFVGTPTTLTLTNKASYTYTMLNSYWSQTGAGLFDGIVQPGTHTTDQSVYWAYDRENDTKVQITVSQSFRIWRKSMPGSEIYSGQLQIQRLENGVYVDRTSLYSNPNFKYGYSTPSTVWANFTTELPAGTYRFNAIGGQYRIDSEWFIEKKI